MKNILRQPVCSESCPTLCDPMDCSPPGSSDHGIFQAILKWVVISSSRGSSWPRDQTCVFCISCIGRWVFTPAPPGKANEKYAKFWDNSDSVFSLGYNSDSNIKDVRKLYEGKCLKLYTLTSGAGLGVVKVDKRLLAFYFLGKRYWCILVKLSFCSILCDSCCSITCMFCRAVVSLSN